MNIKQLEDMLKILGIPRNLYNISGQGTTDQKLCLARNAKGWEIFYSERGQTFDRAEFMNEEDACKELLKRLL